MESLSSPVSSTSTTSQPESEMVPNNSKKQTVLVTGSSGCLGQHIVKLLHERDSNVQEIRCFDLKPFQNNLRHKILKEMQIITADIRSHRHLVEAMKGVDVVIHCASLIDVDLNPNETELHSVNVDGTQHVVDASIEANVPILVHISTASVVEGPDHIYYCTENTCPKARYHILGPYSKTKQESEEIVKDANGKLLADGINQLRTVILRPTLLYGEEDNHFITKVLSIAKARGNQLRRIDNVFTRFQPTYVGNAAYAVLRAKDCLLNDEKLGGEEFFITDDTKILDPFDFFEQFLKIRNMIVTKRSLPFWFVFLIMSLYCWLIHNLKPIINLKLTPGVTPSTIRYITSVYFFSRVKATLRLDYEPLYSYDESIERSLQFYQKVPI